MQGFKAFFKTAKKSLPMNLIYFFVFTGIALALSHSSADTKNPAFSSVELSVAVVDQDRSDASAALKEYLAGIHHLTDMEYDKNTLLNRLFYRDLNYILILPAGFEQKLVDGETELFETVQIPGVYSSAFVDQQIHTYLKTLTLYLAGHFSLKDALRRTAETLDSAAGQVHILDTGSKQPSSMREIYYYFQFLPYVIFSMILCGMTPILTTFWKPELAQRISCSSFSLLHRNLQLALGSILYCFGIWILFGLTAFLFYGSALLTQQGILCMANSLLLLPVAIAVSLIISCFCPPANTINMLNNIVTLGMSFLCGIFVPQQQLGDNVLAVSRFLPFYWYIKNNDLIFEFSGQPFQMRLYWSNMGIQALFICALAAVALMVSKYRQKAR